ncbi:MAG TPA: S8 family serine peptidase, partial [Anaerolinea sp.]|nr:S8 family serine peptidase [Anaerolinea sp.]
MRKIFVVAMLFLLVAALLGPRSAVQAAAPVPGNPGAGLQNPPAKVQPGEFSTVVVVLRDQADVSRVAGENRAERAKNVVRALQDKANRTQPGLRGLLEARQARKLVLAYQPLWIINGFSVTASQAVIEELAQNPDVLEVLPDDIQIVSTGSYAAPEANVAAIQAPALWDMGFSGQGVVVANVDSGVDVSHPDLAARWRGGSNSWFDPYGQHPVTPTDMTGHGTWTMGILLGGDAGGTSIGVAPGAQWIAAKIFNDQGASTVTAIHQAYQWLLDPDGNPNTSDAPQVVNNSWSFANPGCNLTFEPDLQALVSAGILPVFAAGNGGPGSGTSYSPANNPSAFSVGAFDNNGVVWWMSSRGPSSCANSGAVFPDLSAPGVDIYTSGLYGTYYLDSGTSFAAPHVAGGLALLLSAFPGLSAADQENALVNGAVDLGAPGPDYNYGNGGLNLLAAYNWLAGAAPTATPTLAPTDTP